MEELYIINDEIKKLYEMHGKIRKEYACRIRFESAEIKEYLDFPQFSCRANGLINTFENASVVCIAKCEETIEILKSLITSLEELHEEAKKYPELKIYYEYR